MFFGKGSGWTPSEELKRRCKDHFTSRGRLAVRIAFKAPQLSLSIPEGSESPRRGRASHDASDIHVLQPSHGAFSFAQPLDSVVHLPSEAKVLGVSRSNPLYPFLGLSGDRASSFFARSAGGEILPLFPRRLQFPIPVSLNLVLMPGEQEILCRSSPKMEATQHAMLELLIG
jgi:hypothetical protein